jgi:predicted  nucleic acid-binding Zn-ribbon protein
MNDTIQPMVALQNIWDKVIKDRDTIDRNKKAIQFWEKKVNDMTAAYVMLENDIKKMKAYIKEHEIDLSEKDAHSKKLEERKFSVKTEKELQAIEHELDKINIERGTLEDDLLEKMETLGIKDDDLYSKKQELETARAQSDSDIQNLNRENDELALNIQNNEQLFDDGMSSVAKEYHSKFRKLIQSKDGKAIVPLEDKNCGACHFEIPMHLTLEIAKGNSLISCTNCGKYLYKKQ